MFDHGLDSAGYEDARAVGGAGGLCKVGIECLRLMLGMLGVNLSSGWSK